LRRVPTAYGKDDLELRIVLFECPQLLYTNGVFLWIGTRSMHVFSNHASVDYRKADVLHYSIRMLQCKSIINVSKLLHRQIVGIIVPLVCSPSDSELNYQMRVGHQSHQLTK
jgi:hypothetical protein